MIVRQVVLLGVLGVCLAGGSVHGAGEDPSTMPLLPGERLHLYTQEAYEAFDPVVTAAVDSRYDELVDAGMDTARYLFDWRDVEPEPGVFDVELVIEAMESRAARGIRHHFCNLVVIDSEGLVVPDYIEDWVEAGVRFDDPRITDAFARVLDALVPLMLPRGMFVLALSNEPGGYYEVHPDRAASFRGFIEAAIQHAHELEPRLSCTVVFAGAQDPAIPALMPLLDVAAFNTYFYFVQADPGCTFEGFPLPLYRADTAGSRRDPSSRVGRYLDDLIEAAGGRLVNIQEIGQATGWNDAPRTLGRYAGLANQRSVYRSLARELHVRRAHIRTACNWTLNDHTEAGMQYFIDGLIAEGMPLCFADNIAEIFGPAGIVRSDTSASKKPAFDDFVKAVAFFARDRRPRR